jgi:hypothetical protein
MNAPTASKPDDARPIFWSGFIAGMLGAFAAIGVAVAFFALVHFAGRGDDLSAEQRLSRSAHELCTSELGPGAQVLWTLEGDLVCRPATLTAGGQP